RGRVGESLGERAVRRAAEEDRDPPHGVLEPCLGPLLQERQDAAAEAGADDPGAQAAGRPPRSVDDGVHDRRGYLEVVAEAHVRGPDQAAEPGTISLFEGGHELVYAPDLRVNVPAPL